MCIAGMHRSGTSMVARLLAAAGLYLGLSTDLVAPTADDPDGFGENIRFLRLNDQLLATFGGFWDRPPRLHPGWPADSRLVTLRRDAANLIERFRGHEPWGWKDPRNSLTLPFWQAMIPGLRVVVCVRHPYDVAASLQRRGAHSLPDGVTLWRAYTRSVVAAVPTERRIVTHYDAYLDDAAAELRRVADALWIPVDSDEVARACALVADAARLPRTPPANVRRPNVSDDVASFYLELCAEAGPVYARALSRQYPPGCVHPTPTGLTVRRPPDDISASPSAAPRSRKRTVLDIGRRVRRVWRQEGMLGLVEVGSLRVRRHLSIARETVRRVARRVRHRRRTGSDEL